MPLRSNKVIFVPFCILCQSAKAIGLTEHYPAVVGPLVKLLNDLKINIVQLPCPEMLGEGLVRNPYEISYYERPDFLILCKKLAHTQADIIEKFISNGFDVVGILGIERSPSCSLDHVRRDGAIVPGKGVFIGEIMKIFDKSEQGLFHISIELSELDLTLKLIESRILKMDNEI